MYGSEKVKSAKVICFNFQPLEVVSHYRDTQPQVVLT